MSPSSEAFSHTHTMHTHPDAHRNLTPQANIAPKRSLPTNGTYAGGSGSSSTPSQSRRPKNVFEFYCNETRPILEDQHQQEIAEDKFNMEGVLASGWSSLGSDMKEQFTQRYEHIKRAADLEKESGTPAAAAVPAVAESEARPAEEADEDTEMADDTGTPGAGADAGGFTAVNRN